MNEKLKRAARSPHTTTSTWWLTLVCVAVANVAGNWPLLQARLPAHWWMLGSLVLAVAGVALRHWERANNQIQRAP